MKKILLNPEPLHNDLAHVGWVIALILVAALLFCPLIWLFTATPANAVVTSGYYVVSTISRGYDTWTVTSCSLFVAGGWNPAKPDSTVGFSTQMLDGPGAGYGYDTLARYTIITPANLNQNYNPQFYAVWRLSNGAVIRDNSPQITHMTSYTDYLRTAVEAEAIVNYDSIADIVNAAFIAGQGGQGSEPVVLYAYDSVGHAVIPYAKIRIRSLDTSTIEAYLPTGVSGVQIFSLDSTSVGYPVDVQSAGYFMDGAYQLVTVPEGGLTDTIYLYTYTPNVPPPPGLTPVTFNFYAGTGDSLKNVILQYKLDSKSGQNWSYDSTKILDPSRIYEARSLGSGGVTVYVVPNDSIYSAGYQVNKTMWQFWALNPDTKEQLLGTDGIKIFVPASATSLVWPRDFR